MSGTILGALRGCDLADAAEHEWAVGRGHLFNAKLLNALRPLVPSNKTVGESVKPTKLKEIFDRLNKDGTTPSAVA